MKDDPIVEEVRATRAQLIRKYGSAKKWAEHIMAHQKPGVTRPLAPKKPVRVRKAV